MQRAKKRIALITVIYWFLLAYIMSALVWWFVALNRQNNEMAALRLQELNPAAANYPEKKQAIEQWRERKYAQYVGEGVTFMLLIWVGAVFVYLAVRRYLRLGQQQQNFMMAVTHELKTPIAVSKLNIETMRKRRLDEQQRDRLLQLTLAETERLNDLCDNILLASRYEAGSQSRHHEELALDGLLHDIVSQYRQRFPDRHISLEADEELAIAGDAMLLRIMINNLVDNALKYTDKQSPITLRLLQQEGVLLEVADHGPGIADKDKQAVFQKFYRLGNEQTRKAKGTGIGLYLVQRIVADHGGTVSIKDNVPQGAIFTIHFPAYTTNIPATL